MTNVHKCAPHAAALYCTPRLIVADGVHLLWFECMKAVPALHIVERALASGVLKPGAQVVETSSGTFALGLALVCRQFDLDCVIVCDPAIDTRLQRRLTDLGCRIEMVNKCAVDGGYQSARLERLTEILNQNPDAFWPRQYDNPDNPASYATLAEALIERLGPRLALVATVGSGGSSAGFGRPLRTLDASTPVIGVDTFRSVIFGQPDGSRLLRGLGNSLVPDNIDHTLFDDVHFLDAPTGFGATRALHSSHGIFAGPTTGAAWWVGRWVARQYPNRKVIAIGPDDGHRYIDTIYSDDWLKAKAPCSNLSKNPDEGQEVATCKPPWARFSWRRRLRQDVISQDLAHVG
ncbi:pyridoxal-phosphate dependent enzyme [Roseibium sp.]|uniref:pyridoxal-phosphate dependent enzyme n=1 Tax=Roseibium sp. TaxID=1936156 RepID=UPI003266D2EB